MLNNRDTNSEIDTKSFDNLLIRLRAVKYYEEKTTKLELQFYKDVHELEKKYNLLFDQLFSKREEITSGTREPEKEELAESDIVTARLSLVMSNHPKAMGIPNFWFWVFKNSAKLYELMQRSDVPILTALRDIKLIHKHDFMGFTLEFRFGPNRYFSNEILTKEYQGSPNEVSTFPPSFDSSVINSSRGCTIDWYPNMDPSYRMVNMQQTNDVTKLTRVIAKPVKMKTFFNFFSPPTLPDDPRIELKPEYEAAITRDYEIGLYFREEIIPNAYLFFTGQIVEKEDNFVDVQILPDRPPQVHQN